MSSNLAEIRRRRRLTTAALSELLSRLGRPILANGITKIEKGSRRVDTDDLIALAIALDVSPNALLFPQVIGDEPVELTPGVRVSPSEAWLWASGSAPLPNGATRRAVDERDRELRFRRENRPHDPGDPNFVRTITERPGLFDNINRAVMTALRAGISAAVIREYVNSMEPHAIFVPSSQAQLEFYEQRLTEARAAYEKATDAAERAELEAMIQGFEHEIETSRRSHATGYREAPDAE